MFSWKAPENLWSECWIIAGGASWLYQFGVPEELIEKLVLKQIEPSVVSDYLSPIHDKHVIAVNNAYQIGNWIDILVFGDHSWYKVHRMKLSSFPGLKIACYRRQDTLVTYRADGVKYLRCDGKHKLGINYDPTCVAWNHNTGAAAINVAFHFGAKKIMLLGYDMNMNNNVSHWHGSHGASNDVVTPPPFHRHLMGFPSIKRDLDSKGVTVLNVNPNSAIKEFKKVSLKEIL